MPLCPPVGTILADSREEGGRSGLEYGVDGFCEGRRVLAHRASMGEWKIDLLATMSVKKCRVNYALTHSLFLETRAPKNNFGARALGSLVQSLDKLLDGREGQEPWVRESTRPETLTPRANVRSGETFLKTKNCF